MEKQIKQTKYDEWESRCREHGLTDVTIGLLKRIAEKDPLQPWEEFAKDVKRHPSYIRRLRQKYGHLINDYVQSFVFSVEMPEWFRALDARCKEGDVQALKLAFELERRLKRDLDADHVIIVEHHVPRAETPSEDES